MLKKNESTPIIWFECLPRESKQKQQHSTVAFSCGKKVRKKTDPRPINWKGLSLERAARQDGIDLQTAHVVHAGFYLPEHQINTLKKYPNVTREDIAMLLRTNAQLYDYVQHVDSALELDYAPEFGWFSPQRKCENQLLLKAIVTRRTLESLRLLLPPLDCVVASYISTHLNENVRRR